MEFSAAYYLVFSDSSSSSQYRYIGDYLLNKTTYTETRTTFFKKQTN
jgi:hypothetical protein